MLLSFEIENWMSFRNPATLSLVATKERQHGQRVPRVAKHRARILPTAAIYGANASGKTNFFQALGFVKRLVVKGTEPEQFIEVEPYLLDSEYSARPSRFKLEILAEEVVYEYSFAVNPDEVVEEKLIQFTSTGDKLLYSREGEKRRLELKSTEDGFIEGLFQNTRDNQLFLNNAMIQKESFNDDLARIYNWFKESLVLVAPDARFGSLGRIFDRNNALVDFMNEKLSQLDTGTARLGLVEISIDEIKLPKKLLQATVGGKLKEGNSVYITDIAERYIVITRRNGENLYRKIIAFHPNKEGKEVEMELFHESDGTRRIIELLPAFFASMHVGGKVFVVDEIDRSLHTTITRHLMENYLAACNADSRNQLLLTTHDLLLMDQNLFRRDEMWVTERGDKDGSQLICFSDYKDIRYDKDIRKSYLLGKLGGIPRIN